MNWSRSSESNASNGPRRKTKTFKIRSVRRSKDTSKTFLMKSKPSRHHSWAAACRTRKLGQHDKERSSSSNIEQKTCYKIDTALSWSWRRATRIILIFLHSYGPLSWKCNLLEKMKSKSFSLLHEEDKMGMMRGFWLPLWPNLNVLFNHTFRPRGFNCFRY